jgi:hypothetical protein
VGHPGEPRVTAPAYGAARTGDRMDPSTVAGDVYRWVYGPAMGDGDIITIQPGECGARPASTGSASRVSREPPAVDATETSAQQGQDAVSRRQLMFAALLLCCIA